MKKILFMLAPILIYANCTYTNNINFDLTNNQFTNSVKITDSLKPISLNTEGFNIKNIDKLKKDLKQKKELINFSYTYKNENIKEDFIYLLNNWYPSVKGLCEYKITTNLSNEYKSIFEKTSREIEYSTFISSPKYIITSKSYNNMKVSTYFFKNDEKLALKYLDKSIEYIKIYEKMLGTFPYSVFNIVENHATTGYSMPTYTLVGSYLLDKPYLLNRSLGHEILHQYFGNSIFNDNSKGNYSEGIVTYLADDYYEKLKGKEVEQRKAALVSFDTVVTKDFPVKDFKYRYDKSSMAIGYTKLAFVFSMLENKIGEERFSLLLKKLYKENAFKEVNLLELRDFFQKNTKEDLTMFFAQWLDKKGKIDFSISKIKSVYDKNGFNISFELKQNELFSFELPIFIKTYDDAEFTKNIKINKKNQKVSFYVKSEPLEITFDKEYKLFRKLFTAEYPLNIGKLINTKELILLMDKKTQNKYKGIEKVFPQGKIVFTKDLKFEDLKKSTVVFLDKDNENLKHFFPRLDIKNDNSFLNLKIHIFNKNQQMAIFHVKEKLDRSFYMLKHYTSFKDISISGRNISKIKDKTKNGLIHTFNKKATLRLIKKEESFNTIIKKINNAKIVYLGESHVNFTHHLNQLRIIKELYKKDKRLAIGMEMFNQDHQKDLDRYLAGKTTLNEFLKEVEYFKNWGFSYDYYKGIIDFAKDNKIAIIALNISRDTIKDISSNGLLSVEDKESLPNKIDQSNIVYKKDLMQIYDAHNSYKKNHNKDTKPDIKEPLYKKDYFYQSQLTWDEIMAENITKFMNKNRDYTFAVIVGSGHISKHFGIPSRVYADTKLSYKVILNDSKAALENDIVINNTKQVYIKPSLKIGVYLESSQLLKIIKLVPKGYGEKIGLKKDDMIIKLNGEKVKSLFDLKRILYILDDLHNVIVEVKRDNKVIKLK